MSSLPDLHVIDFEGSLRTGIVEFGVATLSGGKVSCLRSSLCRPARAVPAAERDIHGLSNRDLEGQSDFSSHWALFCDLRTSGVLAAHSAGTEASLLRSVWPYPRAVPDWLQPGSRICAWEPWIDTERLARRHRPGLASYRLESLILAEGLLPRLVEEAARLCPPGRARWHCAPYDALAAALLLENLVARHPRALRDLIAASAPARIRENLVQGELF